MGLVPEVEVPRWKLADPLALPGERLHLRRHKHVLVAIPSDVEGNHANRVARDQERLATRIVQDEAEDAVDPVQEFARIPLVVEVEEHLAVRERLECVRPPQPSAQVAVVVDLPVYREYGARIHI